MLRWTDSRWSVAATGTTIVHPEHKRAITLSTLILKQVDDTHLLSDDAALSSSESLDRDKGSKPVLFHRSSLSEEWTPGGLSLETWLGYDIDVAVLAHKVMFAILYDYHLTLKTIQTKYLIRYNSEDHKRGYLMGAVDFICLVAAYAEYYCCLDRVAPALIGMMVHHPRFWNAVRNDPEKFLLLAIKFRNSDIYFESLRHLIANAPEDDYEQISSLLGQTVDDSQAMFGPLIDENRERERTLEQCLLRLTLSEGFAIYNGRRSIPMTTYQNALQYKSIKSDGARAMERSRRLAGDIFGQWLIQNIHGEVNYFHNTPRSYPAGTLALAIQKLLDANNTQSPSDIFSDEHRSESVIDLYVHDFAQGNAFNPKKQIKAALEDLIMTAAEIIRSELPVCDEQVGAVNLTFRSARCVSSNEVALTYFGLDETDVPWKDEESWEDNIDGLDLSLKPATAAFLAAVGMKKA